MPPDMNAGDLDLLVFLRSLMVSFACLCLMCLEIDADSYRLWYRS